MKSCPHCYGTPGRDRDRCLTCWGTGKVDDDDEIQKEKNKTRYPWMDPNHVWKEFTPTRKTKAERATTCISYF